MPIKNLCFQEKLKNTFSIIAPTPVPICETVCCAKVGDCFQWKQSSKCVKWEWKHLVFLSWICSSFKTKLNFCCTQAKYRHVLLEHDLINIAAIFRPLVTKRVDQSSKRLKLFYSACVFLQRLHTSRFDCSVLCLGIASGLNICGRSCDRREEPNLRTSGKRNPFKVAPHAGEEQKLPFIFHQGFISSLWRRCWMRGTDSECDIWFVGCLITEEGEERRACSNWTRGEAVQRSQVQRMTSNTLGFLRVTSRNDVVIKLQMH